MELTMIHVNSQIRVLEISQRASKMGQFLGRTLATKMGHESDKEQYVLTN